MPLFFFFFFSMNDGIETVVPGHEFCQWLGANHHADDEPLAQTYLKQLVR